MIMIRDAELDEIERLLRDHQQILVGVNRAAIEQALFYIADARRGYQNIDIQFTPNATK